MLVLVVRQHNLQVFEPQVVMLPQEDYHEPVQERDVVPEAEVVVAPEGPDHHDHQC